MVPFEMTLAEDFLADVVARHESHDMVAAIDGHGLDPWTDRVDQQLAAVTRVKELAGQAISKSAKPALPEFVHVNRSLVSPETI